jgi:predicted transcriptional regulator
MGTFSVSLPEDEQKLLDDEAEKNERSRAAQVRIILKQWFEKRRRKQ